LLGWDRLHVNWTGLTFTLGLAILAGTISGLAPALHLSQTDLSGSLTGTGRSITGGRRRGFFEEGLRLAAVIFAMVLLAGAGLMAKGFESLVDSARSFEPDGLVALHLHLPVTRYKDKAQAATFYESLVSNLQRLPGIQSAAAVSYMPFAQLNSTTIYAV